MSFYCKFCGEEFSNLQDLVNSDCRNHPNGSYSCKHEPL